MGLPAKLLRAQEEGRLVVFAGAGVSMGRPSRLPSFGQLAKLIAGGKPRERYEPLDRFLGRLEDEGVAVHERGRTLIDDPKSRPTTLHSDLLRLFTSADTVRVVTTNFDTHFTSSAKMLFGTHLKIAVAPALPLAKNFNGIVHLHGSVDELPSNLILTDKDFGRAYLTEGWARRFVFDLFSNTDDVVLFVGYSHQDVVMNYVARGLAPGGSSRFAFDIVGSDDRWRNLGIEAIAYPKVAKRPHLRLQEAIGAWATRARLGSIDHKKRIESLALVGTPPLEPEEIEYLESIVEDARYLPFFCGAAKGKAWLEWIADKPAFAALFEKHKQLTESSITLASWFASNYVIDRPRLALELLQKKRQRLNSHAYSIIIREIAYTRSQLNAIDLNSWLAVLFNDERVLTELRQICYILLHKSAQVAEYILPIAFQRLYSIRLSLGQRFEVPVDIETAPKADSDRGVSAEIEMYATHHALSKCWRQYFCLHLDSQWKMIVSTTVNAIARANDILRPFGIVTDDFDQISGRRSAIESHPQDDRTEAPDVLVDIARDSLEWLLENDPRSADLLINQWSVSRYPVLRRLAVHGVRLCLGLSADEKIRWILDRGWIWDRVTKHENFTLLRQCFPQAGTQIRNELLARIDAYSNGEDESRDWQQFKLLTWLDSAEPGNRTVRSFLEKIWMRHPKWNPEEHPDFDGYVTVTSGGPPSPIPMESLLLMSPQEIVMHLQGLLRERNSWDHEGMLDAIRSTACQNFGWSIAIAEYLLERGESEATYWDALLFAWRDSALTESQWAQVLNLIAGAKIIQEHVDKVLDFVGPAMRRDENQIPEALLHQAEDLARSLQVYAFKRPEVVTPREQVKWLDVAINCASGKLTLLWLQAISRHSSMVRERDSRVLPEKYKRVLQSFIEGAVDDEGMAVTVLCSRAHFLLSTDPEWTVEHIMPLFDWTNNGDLAEKAWHGFAILGQWGDVLLPILLPHFRTAFAHLSRELEPVSSSLCNQAATLAVYSPSNPMRDGWLRELVLQSEERHMVHFANAIDHALQQLDKSKLQSLWSAWMMEYWRQRNDGIPKAIGSDESAAMAEWVPRLALVSSDAVSIFRNMTLFDLTDTSIFHRLNEAGSAIDVFVKLNIIEHALTATFEEFYHCDEALSVLRLIPTPNESHELIVRIIDRLVDLGCHRAAEVLQ